MDILTVRKKRVHFQMGNEFINAVGMMGKVMETLQKRKQVQKCPRFQTVQIVEAREAANRLHLISDKGHTHTTLRERKKLEFLEMINQKTDYQAGLAGRY